MQEYAEEKLSRLHRYLQEHNTDEVTRVELELTVEKNPSIATPKVAEATIFTRGPVIRAKESSTDMYASIDMVTDKLQRQVKKYRDKLSARPSAARRPSKKRCRRSLPQGAPARGRGLGAARQQPPAQGIVKTKQFLLKPMSPEEAVLQMELVGHDFFVFTNAETNDTNVVYQRRDGQFGVIEPSQE